MIQNPNIWSELRDRTSNGIFHLTGTGGPLSGVWGTGTGAKVAGKGSTYTNLSNGVVYFNEGDATTPYWTPMNFRQPGLISWWDDFRDGASVNVASGGYPPLLTATTALQTFIGSGLKVVGEGIAETDSGATVAIAEDGAILTLTTTDEAAHNIGLSVGLTTSVPFQPNSHGPVVIDALLTNSSAITLRNFFFGFVGTCADNVAMPVTGSATTITLVQDDLAGLMFDVGLTATTRLYAPHNKSDEAATIATTATGVDTGVAIAAAGTYQRLRVEISAAGAMTCFVDKVQVTSIAASLDVDEEIAPLLLLGSTSTAVKTMLVKYFGSWGTR